MDDGRLAGMLLTASDRGPGFDIETGRGEGLGLAGLRESLGGAFEVVSSASGTRLVMSLRLADQEPR